MKSAFYKLTALFALIFLSACIINVDYAGFKIMSYNIRCGFCEKPGDINHWELRKNRVFKILNNTRPQLLGLQEAEEFQVKDIIANLNYKAPDRFKFYGIGREEGEIGERNAIIWDSSRFEIISKKTIWLNQYSKNFELGWDAKYRRTATIVEFKEIKRNQKFYIINTHLDNSGPIARLKSAELINDYIKMIGAKNIILMGDFNDVPNSNVHKEFSKIFYDTNKEYKDLNKSYTFNGFGKDEKNGNIIDYIMVKGRVSINNAKIVYDKIDGNYASDHFPIIANLKLD